MIGQTISHYRILAQIGEGGMGVVYVAEDNRLGRRVAVKIPHAGKDEDHYRARFLREARAVSHLNHRSIAAVYDYGETEDKRPFIVMELVTGQTLGDILTGTGLSLQRAVEIIGEVAEALSEAHRRGIVHRDIKPSNVIVTDRGEVKVLDFGLAKHLDDAPPLAPTTPDAETHLSAHTRSDVVVGTPLYLSPEQARGARVDGRSDIFALGALLYECIAGRPAFSGANVIEIGAQVLHVDPPPPSQFNGRVPSELDRVTLKALAKKPDDRYQTAEEMAADLKRAASRLSLSDTSRTRRLTTGAHQLRTSAFTTIAEGLRRPRFSPLALFASLAVVLLGVWAVAYWSRPSVHQPSPEAVALYERGVDAMREGAYQRASALLEEAVAADGRFALAHARLAEALAELDYFDRAKDELLAASALVPNRKALSPIDALYFDAISATLRRDYAAAVRAYEEAVRLRPDSPQVRFDLGRAYEKNNEADKAVASYTEATARDPRFAAAFLRLGVVHGRKKNLPGANAAFERAAQLYEAAGNREGLAEVHYSRGFVYNDIGKFADAKGELQRALELSRSTGNLYQQTQVLSQLSAAAGGEKDYKQSAAYAREAIEMAQSGNMFNLTARGYAMLGSVHFRFDNYAEAEENYKRALELARNSKLRRVEALALINMGSMFINKMNRIDDGLRAVEQARDFYEQGGFRKEADVASMLIARVNVQKGNYELATQTFSRLLQHAEQAGDMLQQAHLRRSLGRVLSMQSRYNEALQHLREGQAISKNLNNQSLASYALISQAEALAHLGRYDEAEAALKQVLDYAARPGGAQDQELTGYAHYLKAQIALSRSDLAGALAEGREALAIGAQYKETAVDARRTIGVAQAMNGAARAGVSACREALREAAESGNPFYISNANLSLGEALLASGASEEALAIVLRAREEFARAGRVDMEWRALAVAGLAARRAGSNERADEHLAQAAALLPQFERRWGAEMTKSFLARPDVQKLRRDIDSNLARLR